VRHVLSPSPRTSSAESKIRVVEDARGYAGLATRILLGAKKLKGVELRI
jgi:hypothetical protein